MNIQERRSYLSQPVPVRVGKWKTKTCIYFDNEKQGWFGKITDSLPQIWLIDDVNKIRKLDGRSNAIIFRRDYAEKINNQMKLISTGRAYYEFAPGPNYVLYEIDAKPFSKKTTLVARSDMMGTFRWSKGAKVIVTNEPTREAYMRLRKEGVVQEEKISKKEPISEFLVEAFIASVAIQLAVIFVMFWALKLISKRDRSLEKKLKEVLKDGKAWKVYIMDIDIPNAMCIITPAMFLTSKLKKLCTEEEVIAVCLHEAGHITNKDVWKLFASTNTLTGVLLTAIYALSAGTINVIGVVLISFIAVSIMYGGDKTLLRRFIGRRMEYRADSFAVKYGYAKSLRSVLIKLDKWLQNEYSKRPCGKMCSAIRKVDDLLDEHPELKDRLENILSSEKELNTMSKIRNPLKMRDFFIERLQKGY